MKRVYLDNNASTCVDPLVADVIAHHLRHCPGNPSSPHAYGREARYILQQARDTIASYLKVRSKEIIFTSSGTEGVNMIIRGLIDAVGKAGIITTNLEHSSVFSTVNRLKSEGCPVIFLSPGLYGAATPEEVKAAIQPDTRLIALMAVNNETGVMTDIKAIADIAEKANIPFFVDGVALLGKEPFDIPSGVSAMSFSGHKFHAPKGCGFVYIKANLKLKPLLVGGEQEFNRRGGTENLAYIVGMAEAIKVLQKTMPEASQKMLELRKYFESALKNNLGHQLLINGDGLRVCNTVNLAFAGVDGETLLTALDLEGIAASHGSACASGAREPSRILLNMGIPLERVRESLRFSLSRFTTREEMDFAIATITTVVRRLTKK